MIAAAEDEVIGVEFYRRWCDHIQKVFRALNLLRRFRFLLLFLFMRKPETYRNEIKSYIVRTGMTMTEVVDYLSDEYGWSRSVPNLSGKLKRDSLRYGEAVELADALGYDIVWEKR